MALTTILVQSSKLLVASSKFSSSQLSTIFKSRLLLKYFNRYSLLARSYLDCCSVFTDNDRIDYLISPSASPYKKGRSNPQILPDKIKRSSFRPLDFIGQMRYYQKQRFLSKRKHRLKKINRAIEPIEMYNCVKDPQTAKKRCQSLPDQATLFPTY